MRISCWRVPALMGIAIAAACFRASALASETHPSADRYQTATPIKHLVVIFDENVSFDHYFATYPVAV